MCINDTYQMFQCTDHICVLNPVKSAIYLKLSSVEIIWTDKQTHDTFWAQAEILLFCSPIATL